MSRTRSAPRDAETRRIPVTDKQIGYSVLYGRQVEFRLFDDDPVIGYVSGMDSENYFVLVPHAVNPTFSRQLVGRGSVARIILSDEATFKSEKCYNAMESIVNSFRVHMARNVLGRQTSSERGTSS